jgi:adenine-specific DNA-methyltransferase
VRSAANAYSRCDGETFSRFQAASRRALRRTVVQLGYLLGVQKVDGAPQAWASYGEIFTREWVVNALLDLIGYTVEIDLAKRTIVEPSCGSGAFLMPIIERLIESAKRTSTPFSRLAGCIRAFDLQPDHVDMSRKRAVELLLIAGCSRRVAIKLAETWVREADFLLDEGSLSADFVVGNPPYIRLEDMPKPILTAYRARWNTMKGRADIYVGFIERALSILKPDGRLGIICADRWMRNQYGQKLRQRISDGFSVDCVWSMHDVDAFEVDVSAYPAITVLRRGAQGPVAIADTTAEFGPASVRRLVRWSLSKTAKLEGRGFQAYRPRDWVSGGQPWPSSSVERLKMLDHLRSTFPPLEDMRTGTKVSIGVATGADDVYLTSNPHLVEEERLLPLSTTADVESGHFSWSGTYLVNPWQDGALVELERFPKLDRYLKRFETRLRRRHVGRKAGDRWFRTIDNVRSGLVERPKLLIQDMKAAIHPVLEPGGHYPHHNLYYVVSDTWDLEVLGGLLLSRVAQAFIEAYCVRMRGNTLRFQAQYLRQIRVPRQEDLSPTVRMSLRRAFRTRDVEGATRAALCAYGLDRLPD